MLVNHLFVTQDYPPDMGGMARRHVELVRRFSDHANTMGVSAVRIDGDRAFDAGEPYDIHRQPFHFREANRFGNQVKWARWLTGTARGAVDVLHCGNIRPAGYGVWWTHRRLGLPYIVYVNGGDLLRERKKSRVSHLKRAGARRILGDAAGIAATSAWVAELTGDVMRDVGITSLPPVSALDLGTDPVAFAPGRDRGLLRRKWNVGDAPLVLTVARLVPHKGQDMGIRAVARLASEFPTLRYVIAGGGHDEARLRSLTAELAVADRVIFTGELTDDDLAEAYATSTVYLGASRVDNEINVEGFGISFLEASSSGLPVVAGDSGGVRSAVRDGETGVVVPPSDAAAIAAAIGDLLRDGAKRSALGSAGRRAVETHFNWDRVARDTREFTLSVTAGAGRKR